LIEALEDEDERVRQAASEALVKIRGPAEVNVLQED
jgi:HEAT repeat protein